jgi:polar amino acid transport system substrate-binding protein
MYLTPFIEKVALMLNLARKLGLLATALLVGGAVSAIAADAPKLPDGALLAPGTLNLGADFAAAPNQFIKPDGSKDGLNVDLCGGLAEKLNLKLEWTNLAFPGLVPGLQGKRFDGLCTAIFINPDRLKIMNMVPYVQWGEGLMVAKDSTLGSSCKFARGDDASYDGCFDELAGKTVSVAASGTTNKHLVAESNRIVAAGKPAVSVRAFDTNADAIQAVVSGQADAAYLNDPQAAYYINSTGSGYKLAFAGYGSNKLALATLKENTSLADAFVWALEQMKADGSYQKILAKWGVAEVPSFAYAK